MLIKQIILHNIRSYVDAEISFGAGKTLIAGDIGSGKSTILLAIEFALFGFIKGEISGSMLLRHGCQNGFVELCFGIGGKEIVVHRVLKRSSKSIDQDSGFLAVDGRKTELTATELKAKILDILGYPAELIAKSKSLLFRYTVYTPQEEMKKILLGDKDERLDILRRIFGIDKYKRVSDNSEVFTRHLREQLKEFSGRIVDLDEKKKLLFSLDASLLFAKNELVNIEPAIVSAKGVVEKARLRVAEVEESRKYRQDLLRAVDVCSMSLKHINDAKARMLNDNEVLSNKICALTSELGSAVIEDSVVLKQQMQKVSEEISCFEKEKFLLASKTAEASALQKMSANIIQKISALDNCPLCLQKVSFEHKKSIIAGENTKISSANDECTHSLLLQKNFDVKIAEKKSELDVLRSKDKSVELLRFKHNNLAERSKQLDLISSRLKIVEQDLTIAANKKIAFERELSGCALVEEQYLCSKKELDAALLQEKNVELSFNVLREKILNIERQKSLLDSEVREKEKFAEKSLNVKRIQRWLVELFYPLVGSIEKQVLARVYNEFNELFVNWFCVLVDDDFFSARLDDSFTPVLEQNGFDTFAENLSGGEKTACALAYRLALNKAINDIMTLVQTRDLLILDEPTDGFSDAQLDKVGEVLDNLGLNQVIIVSHERKIEGFVDTVLRISKEGHISAVV